MVGKKWKHGLICHIFDIWFHNCVLSISHVSNPCTSHPCYNEVILSTIDFIDFLYITPDNVLHTITILLPIRQNSEQLISLFIKPNKEKSHTYPFITLKETFKPVVTYESTGTVRSSLVITPGPIFEPRYPICAVGQLAENVTCARLQVNHAVIVRHFA